VGDVISFRDPAIVASSALLSLHQSHWSHSSQGSFCSPEVVRLLKRLQHLKSPLLGFAVCLFTETLPFRSRALFYSRLRRKPPEAPLLVDLLAWEVCPLCENGRDDLLHLLHCIHTQHVISRFRPSRLLRFVSSSVSPPSCFGAFSKAVALSLSIDRDVESFALQVLSFWHSLFLSRQTLLRSIPDFNVWLPPPPQ
jgi:hypothetical protein